MRFLVDAQLPRRLAGWLREAGHDTLHTLDLPRGNQTSDAEICLHAKQENRAVITKDADFVIGFLLTGQPEKLLLVSTGNISNHELQSLFVPNFEAIVSGFTAGRFLELTRTALIVHA